MTMVRSHLLGVPFALAAFYSQAQPLLQGLGGGVGLQGVIRMVPTEQDTGLILAGAFAYANGIQVSPGILQWHNGVLRSIGCGVGWDCVAYINHGGIPPTFGLAEWEGSIYIGGEWTFTRDGETFNYIMRWNGEQWLPLGQGLDSKVTSIRVIDDQLIVTGWFQYADTVLANGLARWDGERWHRVVDVPQFSPGDNNFVNDVAKFQGQWHIGGLLMGMGDLARWNGESWVRVGNGFTGPFSSVQKLHIHDDRLYVSGTFSACPPYGVPTNPGSGIVAWDGENWDDLGGGTCGAGVPDVMGTTWWNGNLYVSGRFNRIGGVPAGQVAKWNGQQWCAMLPPGFFSGGGPNALVVYNDSLYVGGAFTEDGPPPMSCFAKWVGGDQTFGCGTYVGVEEDANPTHWVIYPNPTRHDVQVGEPPTGTASFSVVDVLGRTILQSQIRPTLDLSALAPGTYVVLAHSVNGIPLARTQVVVE